MNMLQQTIETYSQLARMRGCSANLPIRFSLNPDSTTNNEFILIVAYAEPTFTEIPYNVLWLDMSSSSPTFKQILRRVSHISDGNHRGTWFNCAAYSDLFSVPQFYSFVVENPQDLGLTVSDTSVPLATTQKMGRVMLESGTDDVVVCSDDPRMSDARNPLPHESMHPDYPRTMIKINQAQYAALNPTPPIASAVLVLTNLRSTDPNVFEAEWRKLTESDVAWTSPTLNSLEISLYGSTSYVQSGTNAQMLATAFYSDHTDNSPVGVQWSIQSNALGVSIGAASGVVSSPVLAYDTDLLVTASLTDPIFNNTVTNTYVLRILATTVDAIVGIEIKGQTSYRFDFDFASYPTPVAGDYTVSLVYQSGKREAVVPDTFTVDAVAGFALTNYRLVVSPPKSGSTYVTFAMTNLNASYSGYTTSLAITFTATNTGGATGGTGSTGGTGTTPTFSPYLPAPVSVPYVDPDHRFDSSTAPTTFSFFVLVDASNLATSGLSGLKLCNGSQNTEANFAVTSNQYFIGTNLFNQDMSASSVSAAKATAYGNFVLHAVTASGYTSSYLTSALDAAATYLAGLASFKTFTKTQILTQLVSLAKASTKPVLFYPQSVLAVTNSTTTPLPVGVNMVVSNTTYSYTVDYALTDSLLPYSATVLSVDQMSEGQTTQLAVNLYYPDGSVRAAGSTEIQSWSTDGSVSGTTVDASSLLHAGSVTADTTMVITAHVVTKEGLVFNPTKSILVKNVVLTPVKATISGSTTLSESRPSKQKYTNNYYVVVQMSDGSYVNSGFSVGTWTAAITSGGVGTLTTTQGTNAFSLSAGSGSSSGTVRISVPVSYGATNFTPYLDVNVTDTGNISSVQLVGNASIVEGNQATYMMQINYDDGAQSTTSSAFTLSALTNASKVSISSNKVTALAVNADTAVQLQGSINLEGKAWTATLSILVKDNPPVPTALTINGSTSINEQVATTYSATATLSDGSTTLVTPSWSLDTAITGSAITSAGVYTSGDVSVATVQKIGASYTSNGATVTAILSITVNPVSAPAATQILFGIIKEIDTLAGYNATMLSQLTAPMKATVPIKAGTKSTPDTSYAWITCKTPDNGTTGEYWFCMPANSTGASTITTNSPNGYYGYIAIPYDVFGYGYFQQYDPQLNDYGFAGSWDGAGFYDLTDPDFMSGYLTTISGTRYVIYRHDFPFEDLDYIFSIKTHASSAISGIP